MGKEILTFGNIEIEKKTLSALLVTSIMMIKLSH